MAVGGVINISTAKEAIDRIVTEIETQFTGFNVSEVIKAGSLGDGTAVPGDYDIDLVVYSRDFTGQDVLHSPDYFRQWIFKLKAFIQSLQGVQLQYRGRHAENFSLSFTYQVQQGVSIEVDLLASPFWEEPKDFYQFLQTVPEGDRKNYSVCASKWQRQFFKKQGNQTKEYIRRAKAWRNREWGRSREGKPISYLISLLVVRACETRNPRDAHSVTRALKVLVKNEHKDIYWADKPGDFYQRCDYPRLLPSRPRIIDPANPANNVWVTGFYPPGCSQVLVGKIDSIDLSQPI